MMDVDPVRELHKAAEEGNTEYVRSAIEDGMMIINFLVLLKLLNRCMLFVLGYLNILIALFKYVSVRLVNASIAIFVQINIT